ncbi:hypothetical protein PHYSODRAFT_302848 [Phytophthora sojae]|uniref:Uncharacterized protein n=1 Tax=Phytophthora sojae (strain P6497) TaxID=1094619 RepID=G4ZT84_PHYSP|nr:hypothetical protein PHYSODRAFT_302848 [Phytophthora sojae]EGZ13116.1 hypothetical protein PHYSODRAFT_302848 [Phytophthora sojae]|eukprot:XP_009530545.1 hypothetical protein PHYSODRAFT_302848 [Phytophthora sojae]
MRLRCSRASNRAFVAICSAIAALSAESHLESFHMDSEGSGRWPWLIYAICGGTSGVVVPCVEIRKGALTKTDILAMRAALRANYPQPASEADRNSSHQYGFVEIDERTELRLSGAFDGDGGSVLVACACRCRALFDSNDSEWVNLVVPGYGACKAKLGDRGVRFAADAGRPACLEKRLKGALELFYVEFETPGVLIDVLVLVTRGLCSLKLYFKAEDTTAASHVDLCTLARACPNLLHLCLRYATVVVSEHDAALRLWSVKTIELDECSNTLADLVGCLRDPELRIAREVVQLKVTPRKNEVFVEEEVRELMTHDGEFPPLVKEKLPRSSKSAVISVVTAAIWSTKPIYGMDSYILSLIFAFASTPTQRSIAYRFLYSWNTKLVWNSFALQGEVRNLVTYDRDCLPLVKTKLRLDILEVAIWFAFESFDLNIGFSMKLLREAVDLFTISAASKYFEVQ